jgi:branched-chain amino acid transport system permease protein
MTILPSLLAGLEISTLPQQLVNGILLGAIYALIALGYTMVYGVLKLINFAHGEVFMLGAYTALFTSWSLGFTEGGRADSDPFVLVLMLLASMTVCGLVGVTIERLAYRPMRNQARIAVLITAIGVSLLLQYGGQLFLPSSPPPSISDKANPFRGNVEIPLRKADASLLAKAEELKAASDAVKVEYDAQLKNEKSQFDLSPTGRALKEKFQQSERDYRNALNDANKNALEITIPQGQLIMLGTTIVLMALLTYLVMRTKSGRAMRAASLDFDAASLMGINVNTVVTFTFFIGSALAGAGAMMNATFLGGTKIDTFFGLLPGVKAFVAAVLGGIGNIPGAVLGGLLMGLAEVLVIWAGYGNYKDAIAFVVLIVVLLAKPGGLLGSNKVEKV